MRCLNSDKEIRGGLAFALFHTTVSTLDSVKGRQTLTSSSHICQQAHWTVKWPNQRKNILDFKRFKMGISDIPLGPSSVYDLDIQHDTTASSTLHFSDAFSSPQTVIARRLVYHAQLQRERGEQLKRHEPDKLARAKARAKKLKAVEKADREAMRDPESPSASSEVSTASSSGEEQVEEIKKKRRMPRSPEVIASAELGLPDPRPLPHGLLSLSLFVSFFSFYSALLVRFPFFCSFVSLPSSLLRAHRKRRICYKTFIVTLQSTIGLLESCATMPLVDSVPSLRGICIVLWMLKL